MIKKRNALALLLGAFAMIACSFVSCKQNDDDDSPTTGLSSTTASILIGATKTLTLTVDDAAIDSANVTWTSDDATIASVDAGVVTGVAEGTATITAAYSGASYTCKTTVKELTVPYTVTFDTTAVAALYAKVTPTQTKTFVTDDGTYVTFDTAASETRSSVGPYVYGTASGLIYTAPSAITGLATYYYGNGSSSAVSVGDTVTSFKNYVSLSAAQLTSSGATSIKVTINAQGYLLNTNSSSSQSSSQSAYGRIGLVDSTGKVLAQGDVLTASAADYTFYVTPATKIYITNTAVDGTNIVINSISTEASSSAVTATGTTAASAVTLYSDSAYTTEISTYSAAAGNSQIVYAVLTPSDTTETTVTWASDNTSAATVVADSSNPLKATITTVAEGTANITATAATSTVKATVAVTVTAASNPVASVAISEGSSGTLDLAGATSNTMTLTGVITATDTTATCDTTAVTWTSSSTDVTFSDSSTTSGTAVTVTGVLPSSGTSESVTITATAGSKTATYALTVKDSTMLLNEVIDWDDVADSVTTATALTNNSNITVYAQNAGFSGDIFNYYCVSGLYAGDTVSATIKSYFKVASAALTSSSATSVKLVLNAMAAGNSPKIAILDADTLKVLAVSDVLSSSAAADYSFYVTPGENIEIITTSASSSASWYLNSIKAYISSTALDTTAPSAPTGVSAASGAASATVTWTDPTDSDLSSCVVYYSADASTYSVGKVVAAAAQTATVSGLTAGTEYTFYVVARDSSGNASSASSTATATPTDASPVSGNTYTYVWTTSANTALTGSITGTTYTSSNSFVTCTGTSQNAGHGLVMSSSSSMTIKVAGATTITFTGCTYDASGLTFTVKNGTDTVQAATATSTKGGTDGGVTYSASYTGTSATTLTVTWSGTAYVHQLVVAD